MQLQERALAKVGANLKDPLVMKVTSILVDQDWAVVDMFADGVMAKEGWEFDNNYCWVCRSDEVGSSSKLQKYCSATSLELVSSSYTFVLPR